MSKRKDDDEAGILTIVASIVIVIVLLLFCLFSITPAHAITVIEPETKSGILTVKSPNIETLTACRVASLNSGKFEKAIDIKNILDLYPPMYELRIVYSYGKAEGILAGVAARAKMANPKMHLRILINKAAEAMYKLHCIPLQTM